MSSSKDIEISQIKKCKGRDCHELWKETRHLPMPLMTETVVNDLQPCYYLPKCRSLGWLLIPALLNQTVRRNQTGRLDIQFLVT